MLIRLTELFGENRDHECPTLVNTDRIVYVQRLKPEEPTVVYLDCRMSIYVRETVQEVEKALYLARHA